MLVRFIRSGPVKAGPAILHGLPGQIAALDGEDLDAAIAAEMVVIEDTNSKSAPAQKPRSKKG